MTDTCAFPVRSMALIHLLALSVLFFNVAVSVDCESDQQRLKVCWGGCVSVVLSVIIDAN